MYLSKITKVKSQNSFSLRSTIPNIIHDYLNLSEADYIIWEKLDDKTVSIRKLEK